MWSLELGTLFIYGVSHFIYGVEAGCSAGEMEKAELIRSYKLYTTNTLWLHGALPFKVYVSWNVFQGNKRRRRIQIYGLRHSAHSGSATVGSPHSGLGLAVGVREHRRARGPRRPAVPSPESRPILPSRPWLAQSHSYTLYDVSLSVK